MMTIRHHLVLAAVLVLVACSQSPTTLKPSASPSALSEDQRLLDFIEGVFDRELAKSPDRQSELGIDGGAQSQWTDRSDARARRDRLQAQLDLTEITTKIDRSQLSDEGQLNYDLFRRELTEQIANARFRRQSYVVDQFRGQYTSPLTLLQNNHKITDVAGAEAYVQRLYGLEAVLTDMATRMADRATFSANPPAFAFEPMISDIRSILSGQPLDNSVTDHPLWSDFKSKVDALALDSARKQALLESATVALKGPFRRGYQRLLAEIERQQPHQKNSQGVWALPDGKAFYARRVKASTTLDLSPEEIHQLGLREVARIHNEMREIMRAVKFSGDLRGFFEFIRTDPNNFYPNSDEGREQFLADARTQTAEIFAIADQYFHTLPKASLDVRRVEPWRENSTSIAFYNRPSQDGTRPGVYYANLADMTGVQKYVFQAITYHEGVPGHHFQLAQAQEMEGIPQFRKFGGQVAYIEGWALYAEQLAKEMGFYKEPLYDFGRLQNELWRSVRLVVDTGIHHKRWSRQQAIDYFVTNTPLSAQDIVTEVERYFVNPGQALSYKMGMITILGLRSEAQKALKDAFDIRDFHQAVLGAGSLPLPVLESRVRRYIASAVR
ncbi:MAG: DUF885 family protein [Lysobacterales bacterium]